MGDLIEIANTLEHCNTDKNEKHNYLPIYEKTFEPLRDEEIIILEFGIKDAKSQFLWAEYFSRARIIAYDINPKCVAIANANSAKYGYGNRISFYEHNAIDVQLSERIPNNFIDIIIDDGSHLVGDIFRSYYMYWCKVKTGGYYYIEDFPIHHFQCPTLEFFKQIKNCVVHDIRKENWVADRPLGRTVIEGDIVDIKGSGDFFNIFGFLDSILIEVTKDEY